MANDLNIKTKSSKVDNEKTKSQEEELAKLKKAKEEADKKAKELANTKKEEKLETKKETNNNEELVDLAKSIISSSSNNKKGTKITFGFFKGLIIGVVVGFLLATVLGFSSVGDKLFDSVNDGKENVDQLLDETFLGYTALDFTNAILGEASKKQELIVMEQPVKVSTTVTKSGLGNLEIFSKVKNIAYNGTGVYTVDMSKIDDKHIDVNLETKKVTVYIPHAVLQYVNLDLENVEFEDTEKGLLAFGDLSLTTEQVNEIEQSVKDAMSTELNTKELFAKADEFAKMSTWQMFQPLVTAVSPEFVVEMEFVD